MSRKQTKVVNNNNRLQLLLQLHLKNNANSTKINNKAVQYPRGLDDRDATHAYEVLQ